MKPKRSIIPVFVPHLGCPNNCVFCNQRKISGSLVPADAQTVREALEKAEKYISPGAELAFYGGSFTAIPEKEQLELLGAAKPYMEKGFISAIRVSTRPDCINPRALQILAEYGVKTVELGAQSMDDGVLKASGRGHGAEDTRMAVAMLKDAGFSVMLQMMTGLPGDSGEESVKTARELAELKPDGVRIYPTVIIRDTALYEMWRAGRYREHTVEAAVELCSRIVPIFTREGIPIIRLGLNPTEDLSGGEAAAGAYHPALGELVYSRIYLREAEELLAGRENSAGNVTLGVHPSRIGRMTGQKRCNIETLKKEFCLANLKVKPAYVKDGEIILVT